MEKNFFKKTTHILFFCTILVSFFTINSTQSFAAINNSLKLEYKFANSNIGNASGTIELTAYSSSKGTYNIYWANNNGALSEYKRITTIALKDNEKQSFKVNALNAIPEDATRIVATLNNSIKAEYRIPTSKLITSSKKFSFGALSDIHLDGDGDDSANSINDFEKELSYFKLKNVAFVANSGDITRDGRSEDLKAVVKRIQGFGLPFYTARGNHDTLSTCGSMSEWTKIEPNGVLFEKVINNEVFIFMGLNKADYTNPFTSEQISKLTSILNKYKGKRIFMFEHVFVGTVGNANGLYPYSSLSNDGTAGEFKKLIKANKNVIIFTGHSHLDFIIQKYNEYANVQEEGGGYGYRVHCPSATRPRENDNGVDSSKTYDNKGGALGYLIDVYDNFIVLKGRDFSVNKNLPYATYILTTNKNAIFKPNIIKKNNNDVSKSNTIKNNNNTGNASKLQNNSSTELDMNETNQIDNNTNLDSSPKTSDNNRTLICAIIAFISFIFVITCYPKIRIKKHK